MFWESVCPMISLCCYYSWDGTVCGSPLLFPMKEMVKMLQNLQLFRLGKWDIGFGFISSGQWHFLVASWLKNIILQNEKTEVMLGSIAYQRYVLVFIKCERWSYLWNDTAIRILKTCSYQLTKAPHRGVCNQWAFLELRFDNKTCFMKNDPEI